MGNKNTTPQNQNKKSDEQIMKERWLKLADSNKQEQQKQEPKKEETMIKNSVENKVEETNTSESNIPNKTEIIDEKPIVKEIESIIPEEITVIKTNSEIIEKVPDVIPITIQPVKIDKEHNLISKIFRISLNDSDSKFLYLELYHAQLMSENKEEVFRINDLDNILMSIIQNEHKRDNMISYFLETYHRAIEMLERRYKNELEDKYFSIRKMIASYLGLIISSPQNFELALNKNQIIKDLTQYYNDADEEEISFLLSDIINSADGDVGSIKMVFSYMFNIIHLDNTTSKNNFYNSDKIKRNINILSKLFNDHSNLISLYVNEPNFLPKGINGKAFQTSTYLGLYYNIVSFEADNSSIRSVFSSLNHNETESQLRMQINKLSSYIDDVTNLSYLLAENNRFYEYIYDIIRANTDRIKMYANPYTTSSIGFLMNHSYILLKFFFEKSNYTDDMIFEVIDNVDLLFTTSNNGINFDKFDRINSDKIKEIIIVEREKQNLKIFNRTTKIFFTIHCILAYYLKNLDDEYSKIANQLNDMMRANMTNDPKFKEMYAVVKACDVYLRNTDFMNNILKFLEFTCTYIFCLNNKKYKRFQNTDKTKFYDEIFDNIDTSHTEEISIIPTIVIKNIVQASLLIRRLYPDVLIANMESTKILLYFSLIYSSQIDLITNPHLRSEIFDIMIYFFIVNQQERDYKKVSAILRYLDDEFIKTNIIVSLMRVFIDAERLGTSNQFYEKFSIRNKIFYLIENIMKSHKTIYIEQIKEYANSYKFETTKMVNLLMNDLTFLIDECIEKLMEIKRYQDLKEDTERFNALDEETKQLENQKFADNDRLVKTELKLLNSSMRFMMIITECCQDNFMSYKLADRLANLLNYSLDVFTSKRQLKIKINNMHEYGFDPKFILVSLVNIYVYFKDYKEFLEFIVKDERSFKLENFDKVISLKESEKITIDYEIFDKFLLLVKNLKVVSDDNKANEINYDDAPEEFLDPIAAVLMEDPVMLPSSKAILDRTTIETHLLSDSTDPFNRTHLTCDMLIPCPELMEKIIEYKNSKTNK